MIKKNTEHFVQYFLNKLDYNFGPALTNSFPASLVSYFLKFLINNEARFSKKECIGDSIDIAFLVLGEKAKTNTDNIQIIETIPYESANKYSAVFYKKNNEMFCTIKGSLEVVSEFCNKINLRKTKDNRLLEEQNESLAKDGYRVIAIANGKIEEYVIHHTSE